MIAIADTNVILRTIITDDNEEQTAAAAAALKSAEKIVVSIIAFCEVAWILRSKYKRDTKSFIAAALRIILNNPKVVTDTDAVLAGLHMADAGGDFADGVMQHLGNRLAGAPGVFLSFDRSAVKRLTARGIAASIPAAPVPAKQRK